jgi:hypothetical protein
MDPTSAPVSRTRPLLRRRRVLVDGFVLFFIEKPPGDSGS